MNVSYDWLRAFVPFNESPAQIRELITSRVAPVDELVPLRQDLAAVVVGRVLTEAPHPDSDHLHITTVDAGTGEILDVVCGAPNVTAGKLYPFAKTGTTLPNGITIQRRKIRGAVSNGMLCSASELHLGQESDGILELNVDVPPGTPLLSAIALGDTRIVIDVGANRPDLLSHAGVAREIAAAVGGSMALPNLGLAAQIVSPATEAEREGIIGSVRVRIDDPSLAKRFMGVVIRGVKVGASPAWLVDRLASIGSRSINNVVDASNYVLHELGQPTHAYDLAKLEGRTIATRLAQAGEKIVTLDGIERTLTPEMIVIADATSPQGIAGIMGGQASEVTDATTDIFLEVANFDPRRIRAARRALGLSSDASYRFERGVDVELAPAALARVAQIIVGVAGGTVDGAPVDLRTVAHERRIAAVRVGRVERVLGEPIAFAEIASLLQSVGFENADTPHQKSAGIEDAVAVVVPSWRGDITAEIDLIEEIARLHGYDNFSNEIRPARPSNVPDDPKWTVAKRVRDHLVGAGLIEAVPLPFVAGDDATHVRVTNPIAENEAHLRTELLDTLARRAEYNLARMQGDLRLFEIGSVFQRRDGELPREELHVAAILVGRRTPPHYTDPKSDEFTAWNRFDLADARALADEITAVAGDSAPATVRSVALDAPRWAAPAWGLEVSLGAYDSTAVAPPGKRAAPSLATPSRPLRRYQPVPVTPATEFDLALLVPDATHAADVERVIRTASGDLLERLELFDEYRGRGVDAGFRSLAWRLTLRHPERTLRDKEIEGRRAKVLTALENELHVRTRTT